MKPNPKVCFTLLLVLGLASVANAVDAKTVRTWRDNCSSCHGTDGKGATTKGKQMGVSDLSTHAWQMSTTNDKIRVTINDGKKGLKSGRMDAFGPKLKPDVIDALALYVRTLEK